MRNEYTHMIFLENWVYNWRVPREWEFLHFLPNLIHRELNKFLPKGNGLINTKVFRKINVKKWTTVKSNFVPLHYMSWRSVLVSFLWFSTWRYFLWDCGRYPLVDKSELWLTSFNINTLIFWNYFITFARVSFLVRFQHWV